MSTISRLVNCRISSRIICARKPEILTLARHVLLKPKNYKPPPKETHDERNMRLGRPQSPHLTIYRPELQSLLSMMHRATGGALSVYTITFSMAVLALPHPVPYYIDMLQALNLHPVLIMMGKFALAFPLCYHLCNGIRHLIWDLGVFLSMKAVLTTGYLMLTTAISLTSAAVVLL